jgi:hypothetical protein
VRIDAVSGERYADEHAGDKCDGGDGYEHVRLLRANCVSGHDLGEDDAEGFGRRLVVSGEPSAAGARVNTREICKMGFSLVGPRHPREIPKADRRLDIFVRNVRRLRNLSVDLAAAPSDNPMHESPQRNATTKLEF